MLNISTNKNQSTKVRTFQYKEYSYKVITKRNIILQVYYITTRCKGMNSTKRGSRAERKSCELVRRVRNERSCSYQPASQGKLDLLRRAPLRFKLQDLDIQVQGSQKAAQRVVRWSQVVCTYMTRELLKSNRKTCIKNHTVSADTLEQAIRHQVSVAKPVVQA